MSDLDKKIEAVQTWIDGFKKKTPISVSPLDREMILTDVLSLIQRKMSESSHDQSRSDESADLQHQVNEKTSALAQATKTLKKQIAQRDSAVRKLWKAYEDLERHLQEHFVDHTQLNQRLQAQIDEQKRTRVMEQEERKLTEALRDTLATMSRTLDIDKILDHILDTIYRVTPYDGAHVIFVEPDLVRVVHQRGYLNDSGEPETGETRVPATKLAALQQLMEVGQPIAIPDTTASPMWVGLPNAKWVSSNVIAPIRASGKILGFLSLESATTGYFNQVHAERLQIFADQAAIAIQNARLLERAKTAAVLAERNRLANELHDTISQTLWSMSLITERLPIIWEIDQNEGRESFVTLNELSQNALAEMRSLLLELHPSSLTEVKLGDLIHQIVGVIANRAGLNISLEVEEEMGVPPEVHFALYRVVQEALHNVTIHAGAKRAFVYFSSQDGCVELTIQDDGIGFDTADVGYGHLGLSIMKDRIHNVGGTMEIVSKLGEGTLISIRWSSPSDE